MRPQKARQRIKNVLWNRLIQQQKIKQPLKEVVKEIKNIQPELEQQYKAALRSYYDPRGGNETYGYQHTESIIGTLGYISDRWNCAFRIKWLLDLLEQDLERIPNESN